jgi:hypothetical protein
MIRMVTKTDGREVEYLTCAETAKLVRRALKEAFPGHRFSVRSDTYSMGASIHVKWTDGPTQKEVDRVVKHFAGGDFDGMIDLAYHVEHYLSPDGKAVLAYSPGTESGGGRHPKARSPAPAPDWKRVQFGADHVFPERELSTKFRAALEATVEELSGQEFSELRQMSFGWRGRWFEGWGSQLVWQLSCQLSLPPGWAERGSVEEYREAFAKGSPEEVQR